MNTMILVLFGIVWSAISGAIGSVITWEAKVRRDRGQSVVRAAKDAKLSAELTDAHNLIAHLKTDYAALQTQHRALILHTDNLAARIADDDEEIGKLRAMIADPLADKLADALHDSELELERCVQERDALKLQLAEATSKKSEHAQLPKRPRATKVKAVEDSTR